MTFNQQLIEKARKGEIAILNDGELDDLTELLTEIWPADVASRNPCGEYRYYFKDPCSQAMWYYGSLIDRPAHSVKDFFMTDNTLTEIVEKEQAVIEGLRRKGFPIIKGEGHIEPPVQPRTYKVTRQQMKLLIGAEGIDRTSKINVIREILLRSVDDFEEEGTITEVDISVLNSLVQDVDRLKTLWPEYFYIPEGEPVLCKRYEADEWRIRVSDGKGGAYDNGLLSGEVKYFEQIIPFTKTPPK